MSANIISFFGVTGRSGAHLAKQFRKWANRTQSVDHNPRSAEKFEELFDNLRHHATIPPIVFFRSYADTWSMPDALLSLAFPRGRRQYIEVEFDSWAVCVSSSVGQKLQPHLKRRSRGKRTNSKEEHWFYAALLDCIDTVTVYGPGYIFIHFETHGLCVEDSEVIASRNSIAKWLRL